MRTILQGTAKKLYRLQANDLGRRAYDSPQVADPQIQATIKG